MSTTTATTTTTTINSVTQRAYELLCKMSDSALVDVVRNMRSTHADRDSAVPIINAVAQHDIHTKESIDEARLRCECGAGEEQLQRRPHLSQTLICGVCGVDTKLGMEFDEGRTHAYDDEDPDTAPNPQADVSAFGDAITDASTLSGGKRKLSVDINEARVSDRDDMVAALSDIIKTHARNALTPDGADAQPLVTVPFERNARLRTRLYTEARRRIGNALHILESVTCGMAPRTMVVPRFRSVFKRGCDFLRRSVGDWVGSRDACVDSWDYVFRVWYRASGIQQRNYHIFMLIAIVYAGLRTGCAIPPERCVFELSQCLDLMERTGLSSITSLDFDATVRRFYDRWSRILADSGAVFLLEQPATHKELLETPAAATEYTWTHVVMSHIRWFAFTSGRVPEPDSLVQEAEFQVTLVWERRHLLNRLKREAEAAFQCGHAKLHCFWRFLREPERLALFTPLHQKAYEAPWFTDAPVFRDSGAWACAFVCLLLPPRGDIDICDYFGRRARDIMPFVSAIEAIRDILHK